MDVSLPSPDALSRHPVDVGHRTEAIIILELVRRGFKVVDGLPIDEARLRLTPAANNQSKGVRWAADHSLPA